MRILVIGASGRTGRLLLEEAVERGHTVTAFVRRAGDSQGQSRAGLRFVVGNPLSETDLTPVLTDQDVVISCLGQTSRRVPFLLRDAAVAMEAAMARAKPELRYLVVSQALLFPTRNPLIRLLRIIFRRVTLDSRALESVVYAGRAPWTIVRPTRLTDDPNPQGYVIEVDARPKGPNSIRRSELARCLLDEAVSAQHTLHIVGVTSLPTG